MLTLPAHPPSGDAGAAVTRERPLSGAELDQRESAAHRSKPGRRYPPSRPGHRALQLGRSGRCAARRIRRLRGDRGPGHDNSPGRTPGSCSLGWAHAADRRPAARSRPRAPRGTTARAVTRSGEREHQLASDPALSVRGHLMPLAAPAPWLGPLSLFRPAVAVRRRAGYCPLPREEAIRRPDGRYMRQEGEDAMAEIISVERARMPGGSIGTRQPGSAAANGPAPQAPAGDMAPPPVRPG